MALTHNDIMDRWAACNFATACREMNVDQLSGCTAASATRNNAKWKQAIVYRFVVSFDWHGYSLFVMLG